MIIMNNNKFLSKKRHVVLTTDPFSTTNIVWIADSSIVDKNATSLYYMNADKIFIKKKQTKKQWVDKKKKGMLKTIYELDNNYLMSS